MPDDDFIKSGKKMYLVTYSTEHLAKKDKVRFYYALKGRDGISGVAKSLKLENPGRTVLLVPEKHREDIEQFIRIWNLPFSLRKVYVDENVEWGGSK